MGPDNLRPPAHPGIILMTGTTSSQATGGALITSLSHTFIQSNHSEKPAPENHASWEPDKMRMVSWTRWLAADSWL